MESIPAPVMDMTKLHCPYGCNEYLAVLVNESVATCNVPRCEGFDNKDYANADEVILHATILWANAYAQYATAVQGKRRAIVTSRTIGKQFNQLKVKQWKQLNS